MTHQESRKPNVIKEIYFSFSALPLWVQVWVALILVPINFASLLFISEPNGKIIAFLSLIAIAPNIIIIFYEKGFSKLMALPHIIPWLLLVGLILATPLIDGEYKSYLYVLATINTISLIFDIPDAIKWFKGDRDVVRKSTLN
ncbi:MAG: hypothetical protein KBT61_06485 [Paraperlucidibaca sp.]|nr:hypothetical protein [Paraperlucidibaca sp.]MBQ0842597.1 hypothetical protein [Paraperlucidibaca sp.]|tara:strand:+ start:1131 stop:1559 length:429 start_codon:yes stop_codon:yes gene_type:complete